PEQHRASGSPKLNRRPRLYPGAWQPEEALSVALYLMSNVLVLARRWINFSSTLIARGVAFRYSERTSCGFQEMSLSAIMLPSNEAIFSWAALMSPSNL